MKKRSFATRLKASLARTIIAIIIIAVGVWYGRMALNWQSWCPNNAIGVIAVMALYAGATIFIVYGTYLVSPIYIGTFGFLLIEEILARITIDDEDCYDDEEDFRKKLMQLRRRYLW